ncbi:hypothetical protein K3729_00385 [Rhodobacteraceae bacterium S2214]|nr:hypothetical protein K3729_00385 [Rhodobacteraceae bacterium S2214]
MQKPFTPADIKHYPHFDRHLTPDQINELVRDSARVASNKFYPFFLYYETWQPFRTKKDSNGKTIKPPIKSRPIRYAARKDAYILTHYRRILSEKYEVRLCEMGIEECPIAYRKIPKSTGGGKSNIEFAKDAFDAIDAMGDCIAIALDIKGFFENLDHDRIKSVWCDLLGVERLPEDHFTVFKNVTRYRVVDQKEVYRRLGIIAKGQDGIEQYTVPYSDMPTQLCSPKEFRDKICGGDPNLPSIIVKNDDPFGIPQGAPISDLIANFYLMDFDKSLSDFAAEFGGTYMRYSDDILLILPFSEGIADKAEQFAIAEIRNYGNQLKIKPSKTCVVQFKRLDDGLSFQHVKGPQGKNGFEYLGFRYDGRKVYIRDSTISRLYRKVSRTAKGIANGFSNGHPDMSVEEIMSKFNYSNFSQRFNRVDEQNLSPDDFNTWTFYSYLKRASEAFGEKGSPIIPQARKFRSFMKSRLNEAMKSAVIKRDNRS